MPVNLEDLKNKTRGTASAIISDNQVPQTPTLNQMQEEAEGKSVGSLIGKPKVFENLFSRQTYYVHNDFIKAIAENKQAEPNFRDGYKIELISDAIIRSGETEQWEKVGEIEE